VDELARLLRDRVDLANPCDACRDSIPGTLVPAGNDDHHLFVQSCDACNGAGHLPAGRSDDVWAAELVARKTGWRVRRRFDDGGRAYWRPFVAKPGGWDDADFVCVDADPHGWAPEAEIRRWLSPRPGAVWAFLRRTLRPGRDSPATDSGAPPRRRAVPGQVTH
jgi:hypothetical protein